MTGIVTDAMKMALEMDVVGGEQAINELRRVHTEATRLRDLSAAAAIEAKYDPSIARDQALEKAIELTNKYNLSLRAQDGILKEIEDSFNKAMAAQSAQYSGNLPGDDMVAQHRVEAAAADAAVRAEVERLAVQERVSKEAKRIKDDQLTHAQRWGQEWTRLNKLLAAGANPADVQVLAQANTAKFKAAIEEDAKILKAAQDKAAKLLATETKNREDIIRTIRNQEAKALDVRKRNHEAEVNAAVEAAQKRAKVVIDAQEAEDKTLNAERQKALSVMQGYEDTAQRAARDVAFFNAQLASGTITAQEHADALANVDRRMRSMAGGGQNMGYVIGNLATGMEDFVTVISMTGFGMDGFAAATRSASNNVGQAVRGIGTASAAMMAPMISIGVVLAGFAIPAIYKWVTGTEDAAEATKKWADQLERALNLYNSLTFDLEKLNLDRFRASLQVDDIDSVDAIDKQITDTLFKMNELDIEIRKKSSDMAKSAEAMWDAMVPQNSLDEFNAISNAMGDALGEDVSTELENKLREIKTDFLYDSVHQGGEKARVELERQMQELVTLMAKYDKELTTEQRGRIRREIGGLDLSTDFTNPFLGVNNWKNDAAILDRIKAAKEELAVLTQEDDDKHRELIAKLESEVLLLDQMLEKRQALLEVESRRKEAENLANGAAMMDAAQEANKKREADLESLRIQNTKNRLLGDENEAERRLLDLALRRQQILDSKAAMPANLEAMFIGELQAELAQLEDELNKISDITTQTGSMSQASAYAAANKMMLEIKPQDETHRKELIQLITAIKDAIAGKNLMNVELM